MNLFDGRKPKEADVDEVNAARLVMALVQQGWLTAKRLMIKLNLTDRQIRAAANASDGQVISGQKGYRLTREATLEEIDHAAHWLSHQAQAMHRRSIAIQRVRHQHGGDKVKG